MRQALDAKGLTKRFAEDRGGNFVVLTGVMLTALCMAVGTAVDVAQSYHLKSSLQTALDAAVTSTARDITLGVIKPEDARKSVEKFLNVNGRAIFSTQGAYTINTLTVDKTARTLDVTAFANVDLAFPFFGVKDPRVDVGSAAIYSDKQVEVAMMLDVTGSMAKKGTVDKIGDLKKAASNAVHTMLDNQDPKNPRIRVALIPYSSSVNTGDLSRSVFVEPDKKGELPSSTTSTELPPEDGSKMVKEIKAADGTKDFPTYERYTAELANALPSDQDKCATERKTLDGKPDFSADGPDTLRKDKNGKLYYALVNRDKNLSGAGMNRCPDAPIVPLTTDVKALEDSIESFRANGYTAGAIAIQWTSYMLSQSWSNVIKNAGLGDGPGASDSKHRSKVAILMTDGQFNTAFAGVSKNFNGQGATARGNAETLCSNMKNAGVEIYTIGFDLNDPKMSATERDQAKAVLKACATPDTGSKKHYFEASTGEELDAAFQSIIANNERIALTK
ncbi:MAG: pilus assembly protein [Rhizobiales bacterium]|nr:pilus assembly protein [Hyphomicrobiales bacterium]